MKRAIEKLTTIFFAAVFLMISAVNAYAISVDGYCGNVEWKEAEVFALSDRKKFTNGIKSAVVKAQNSPVDGCVYMMIMVEYEKSGNLEDGRVNLRVNDGDTAEISAYGDIISDGGYDIEAAADWDENSGVAMIETAVYFRDDFTSSDSFKLNLVDLLGQESGTYIISFEDIAPEEETDEEDIQNAKSEKIKTTKTGKSKTTKAKTTKKSKSKTTEAFNFKKVDKNKSGKAVDNDVKKMSPQTQAEAEAEEMSQVNIQQDSVNGRKYIYAAAGSVCALGVAVAAVICAMKSNESKNKKD